MNNSYISPFAKPVYVMLKPVGSVCNLACEYCYYLEKGKLYPEVKNHIMSEQLLEKFIKDYLECQTMPQVLFTWHGGETLMRPISFYKKALELQQVTGQAEHDVVSIFVFVKFYIAHFTDGSGVGTAMSAHQIKAAAFQLGGCDFVFGHFLAE